MQRPRNPIGFFPEPIDIDQGTVSNNSGLSLQPPINNMINPIESRLSNDNMASGESSSVNVIHDVPSSSGWSSWESGSRFCLQNQPEPTNDLFPERVSLGVSGNQDRSGPLFMQGVGSNMPTLRLSPHNYNSSHLGVDHSLPFNASSGDIDTSSQESGYVLHETSSGSGSSNGGWGLSCKRKAHEGTSGHSFPGGSSSCSPMAESGPWHPGPSRRNASSNSLSLTTPQIFPPITPPEPTNQRFSFGLRGAYSDAFPSSGMARDAATLRSLSGRVNTGHQEESASFNLSTGGSRNSNIWLSNQPTRQSLFRGSIDLGPSAEASVNSSSAQGPPNATYPSFSSRSLHPFPWDGSSSSRAGSSSRSLRPGERGAPAREEANLRSIPRNNSEHPMLIPVTEMSNMRQDPGGWSLTAGNTSTSFPRNGASSSNHPLPTSPWVPHLNPTTSVSQRFTEVAPWSLFPSVDVEAGSRHMPFHSSSPGPPSSVQDTAMSSASSSQGPLQPFPRSSFSMEGQGNDMLGMPRSLRALAADIQGRHRLISEIRQVLNAMRRRENIRVEDFMHFDQFLYRGIADMHDRHRDMRLDVDNMSYEELLALEERIGDVSTGLSEETILKWMKQQMFASVTRESPAELEPCCICQEDYIDGDDLGLLDCGHDFHTDCIKKWLMQKNICPICKMTGLQSCEGTGSR